MNRREKNKPKVYLVGAGPGDPGLITVRAAEVVALADCIICDKLANPALLKYARPNAEIINVPKRAGLGSFTQQEVNELLLTHGRRGRNVVRLKGGDPCMFGRGSEEAKLLAEAQIDFEIVPGITAGMAVSAYAGIMLTDRNYSSQVIFVTGKEAPGKAQSRIDWQLLAKFSGTIVFYMSMSNLEENTRRLIENGMNPRTPVAVVANVSLPGQRIVKSSVDKIAKVSEKAHLQPPAMVIIGTAARSDERLNWFARKPLFAKSIVVARTARGNREFAEKISSAGAEAIELETVKIEPLTHTNRFLHALEQVPGSDWLIFTSDNGVKLFFGALNDLGKDCRVLGRTKIAAIGTQTAGSLAEFGIKADFVPDEFTSFALGEQLAQAADLAGKKILLMRSALANEELPRILERFGAEVKEAPVYTITPVGQNAHWLSEMITRGQVDWLTFTSPSMAGAFFDMIDVEAVNTSRAAVVSIGPVTTRRLEQLGVKVDITAEEHTLDGMIAAIERNFW